MKPKLLYISPTPSTFVKEDVEFLGAVYDVIENPLRWTSKTVPFSLIRQFFFLLFNIRQSVAVVVMFGGYWSVLPMLAARWFNKPGFLILGGTDCVSFPELNYGSMRKKGLKASIRHSVKNAHMLLPVDDSLIYTQNRYYSSQEPAQGIRHFFPDLGTPYSTIDNGFDVKFWENQTTKIPLSFISVAMIDSEARFVLKGFDLIISAAKQFPNCMFTLIGLKQAFADTLDVPPNVKIYPKSAQKEFKHMLAQSEFYLQISISEGFPNALCEAMASGCIPIGSHVNAIPRIIDSTGFLLEKRDQGQFENLLKKAISLKPEEKQKLSEQAKHKVEKDFPMVKRQRAFLDIIGRTVARYQK